MMLYVLQFDGLPIRHGDFFYHKVIPQGTSHSLNHHENEDEAHPNAHTWAFTGNWVNNKNL